MFPYPQAAAAAAAAAAAGASVFPAANFHPFFSPQLFQYAALFQQQQAAMQQALQQHSPLSRVDLSPTVSDGRASSTIDSSPIRRLQVDDKGDPICPICDEKMANEKLWMEHVQLERRRLLDSIEGAKHCTAGESTMLKIENQRRKREAELQRIRNNQNKRVGVKNGGLLSRESSTPFSRQSNDDLGSPSSSPTEPLRIIKKHDENESYSDNLQCKSCDRTFDHLVISNHSEQPRCFDCFKKLRLQTSLTESESMDDDVADSGTLLNLKNEDGGYNGDMNNCDMKRPRIE